jgi:hypothetical protein
MGRFAELIVHIQPLFHQNDIKIYLSDHGYFGAEQLPSV